LQGVIDQGFTNHDVTSAIGTSPSVRALPPDQIAGDTGVNIFFYQATPNLGWRNECLPLRNVRAERISNQPLALDLHYLVSAHADNDLFSEILLGSAMQTLHENTVFSRQEVQDLLATPGSDGVRDALTASGLPDQIELLKVTPEYLSNEEMSKLWSAVQSNYRSSAAYLVTVVLIEAEEPARSPLPVLARNVNVQPHLLPQTPTLHALEYVDQQTAGRLGELVTISGYNLIDGLNIRAQLSLPSEGLLAEFPLTGTPNNERVQFLLPVDGTIWRSGVYQLSLIIDQGGGNQVESNQLPLTIASTFTNFNAVRNGDDTVSVDVSVEPEIHDSQSVSLIVGQTVQVVESFNGQSTEANFVFQELGPGNHWARIRVDGIDSILINRNVVPPEFHLSQQVTVP